MTGTAQLFDLSGRVAVITGAASGFGRVFATLFAEAGAEIIAADRDAERVQETADIVIEAGGKARAVTVDVADAASVQTLAEVVAEGGRGAHVLVNNAGIANVAKRVHELPIEAWNEVLAVNLTGAFLCSRAVLPLMLAVGGGSIVNISSIAGLIGVYPDFAMLNAVYASAKAGLIGLTRQTAVEYAKDNIRANAIAPGWHGGTRLGEANRRGRSNAETAKFEDTILEGTPMGRRGTPEELGPLALYLASDASSYVTGQVFTQDGGWTAA